MEEHDSKKKVMVIDIPEDDILEILCDYFLEDNEAGYDEWHGKIVGDMHNGLRFIAVYGHSNDDGMKEVLRDKFY